VKAFEAGKNKDINITLQYLFTIARRTVIDFWRKKKELNPTEPEKIFENIVDSSQNVQSLVEQEDDKSKVREIITKLDGDQKDVVIMKFLNDLTTKEVANIMQKSEEAIRKIQSRALKNIRESI
jgi:RNA polymerase sigma-70 factor (ECF subfamily)